MQLGLAVPKAKQSELLDPQGVQKPGFSPTPTPSIRPFPLAHAGSPNPHLQPIFPLTSAHLRLLSSCSSPAGKSAHISVAFFIAFPQSEAATYLLRLGPPCLGAFLMAEMVKNLPAMQQTWV